MSQERTQKLSFSCPVMSNSLQPHGLQHARPLCPPPSPKVCPSSCLLHQWCDPALSSSGLRRVWTQETLDSGKIIFLCSGVGVGASGCRGWSRFCPVSPYRAVVFTDKDAPVSAEIREDFLMNCDDCRRTHGCHASGLVHEPVRPAMVNRRCGRTGGKLEELKLSLSR